MTERISSAQNPRFRQWVKALQRGCGSDGRPILPVEGPKLIGEALAGGWEPVLVAVRAKGDWDAADVLKDRRWRSSEHMSLESRLFDKLAATMTPQEPLVVFRPPDSFVAEVAKGPETIVQRETRLAIADGIQDPGNLGTLIRSAVGFGFDAVAMTEGSAIPASPKVLRASAGALFRARLHWGLSPAALVGALRSRGFLIVVLDARGEVLLDDVPWREPVAIVAGNEGQGVSDAWGKTVDAEPAANSLGRAGEGRFPSTLLRVRIPMAPGLESLNTATSAALAFHSAFRSLDSRAQ